MLPNFREAIPFLVNPYYQALVYFMIMTYNPMRLSYKAYITEYMQRYLPLKGLLFSLLQLDRTVSYVCTYIENTCTHTYQGIGTKEARVLCHPRFYNFSIGIRFLNQARAGLWPAHAWFLDIDLVREVCVCVSVCVCVFVCPSPRLVITSGMIWRDLDPI